MDNTYESQAKYYASISLLGGYVASVHLEDKEDKLFWNQLLQHVVPGEYYFVSSSRSKKSKPTTGCAQCLNYHGYLSKKFFIAIDSDLRYPLQESNLDSEHFVAQTYTYSWENHYCEANGLQRRFENVMQAEGKIVPFDFKLFLDRLSKILFLPFICVIYNECNVDGNVSATVKNVFGCLPSQVRHEWLNNNGEKLLEIIKSKIETTIPMKNSCNLIPTINRMKQLGITEDNVYLHVRGHNLFDMIRSMGIILCHGINVSFTKDVLLHEVTADAAYWQIKKAGDDLHSILSK